MIISLFERLENIKSAVDNLNKKNLSEVENEFLNLLELLNNNKFHKKEENLSIHFWYKLNYKMLGKGDIIINFDETGVISTTTKGLCDLMESLNELNTLSR